MTTVVHCYDIANHFGKTDLPKSYPGEVTVQWLMNEANKQMLNTGAREYQREKVAPMHWKQDLMKTVLCDPYARVPQIHIRVNKIHTDDQFVPFVYKFEIIDGQQRVTTILDFIADQFSLIGKSPKDLVTLDGKEIGSFTCSKLATVNPSIHAKLMDYSITAVWYENLTDQQVSDLFVNVLNNQNDLNDQEKRNAMRGAISSYVRDMARPILTDKSKKSHELFSRSHTTNEKGKIVEKLVHLPKLALKGRMEADEWLAQMIYMCEHGMKVGVSSQKALTEWVRRAQLPTGFACTGNTEFNSYRKRWNALMDWTLDTLKSVPRNDAAKLTPMVAQVICLYGWEIEKNSDGRLKIKDKKKFVSSFFKVMHKWNDINVYGRHKQINKKDMQPFKDLFGGKNPNAMQTISWVLNKERGIDESKIDTSGNLLQGPLSDSARSCYSEWGIVELDPRESFSQQDIFNKWKEQGEKCFYTGRVLENNELVGDHYIPRSWGITAGGITEYSNLVVTDRITNGQKLNMHGDDYLKKIKGAV